MIESHELVALLQLARDEECRFVSRLTEDEREAIGTLEAPAAKDVLAHITGAKAAMASALVAAGAGEDADPSHDWEALFNANHARPFDEVESDAERCSDTLVAEVERLPAAVLASSPAWIDEPTLSDEVVMYGVTHSLTHLFDPLFARGEADDAVRAQQRLLDALPDGANAELRAGALYNLGCLHARLGRDDEAVALLLEATALEPGLADHARDDSDLRSIRARLPA